MKCTWNNRLKCWITLDKHRKHRCPLNGGAFLTALDTWALTGRAPKSASLDAEHLDGRMPGGYDDHRQVKKAEMYCNFDNGTDVCAVVDGSKNITKAICKDMIRGRKKWRKKLGEIC